MTENCIQFEYYDLTQCTFSRPLRVICLSNSNFFSCLYYVCQGDTCYACPRNKDRNSIQASIFKNHIQATHPPINSNKDPPERTIIIEADITSSAAKNAHQKINKHLRP
jgi:hypothetical protein